MISLIGMGPGHPDYVTPEAVKHIRKAEAKVAFGRIAETAVRFAEGIEVVHSLGEIMAYVAQYPDAAVMASGDACFFGILDYLKKKGIKIKQVVPGITSFQYLMSKLQMSWQEASFFSFHGRIQDLEKLQNASLSVVLTDGKNPPGELSRRLFEIGCRGTIHAGFDLSYDSEIIYHEPIGAVIPERSSLSTLAIRIDMQQ